MYGFYILEPEIFNPLKIRKTQYLYMIIYIIKTIKILGLYIMRKIYKLFVVLLAISTLIINMNSVFSDAIEVRKNTIFDKLFTIKNKLDRSFIGEKDENAHFIPGAVMEEWWYFHVIFDDPESELQNWSIAIALSLAPATNNLKFILHDNGSESYGGIYLHPKGYEKIDKDYPGVNVSFNKSYVIGRYPTWNVYAENIGLDETEITANLSFQADSEPTWILGNTGRNKSDTAYGYYAVIRCITSGIITINGTSYQIKGLGYYEHNWVFLKIKNKSDFIHSKKITKPRKLLDDIDYNTWDWINFHFDNGWDMFVGKIYSKDSRQSNLLPGTLWIKPNGKGIMESYFFVLDYKETTLFANGSFEVPSTVRIKALLLRKKGLSNFLMPLFIDITYNTNNIHECLVGDDTKWGQWESVGSVTGKVKGIGVDITLNGWGIMESTGYI